MRRAWPGWCSTRITFVRQVGGSVWRSLKGAWERVKVRHIITCMGFEKFLNLGVLVI